LPHSSAVSLTALVKTSFFAFFDRFDPSEPCNSLKTTECRSNGCSNGSINQKAWEKTLSVGQKFRILTSIAKRDAVLFIDLLDF
jgi:hypothetical protein